MITLLTFTYTEDLYEVAVSGFVITRISRYLNGSSHRQDLEFDECCVNVQDLIIDKISETLTSDAS